MEFKDVFTPPFNYPVEYGGTMIFDKEDRISLTSLMDKDTTNRVIKKLNGELVDKKAEGTFARVGCEIFYNFKRYTTKILYIRGWGRLTGIGALNLSGEEAARLQDDFGDWIVETLNSHT